MADASSVYDVYGLASGFLTPAAIEREHEHVRAVDLAVDHRLRTAAGRGQRVLPAQADTPSKKATITISVRLGQFLRPGSWGDSTTPTVETLFAAAR